MWYPQELLIFSQRIADMLTELALRKLSATGGRREVWDEKLPGFGVRIGLSGTKSFVLMYYAGGKKHRLTLGRYPVLSLAEARRRALEALATIAGGGDPKPVNSAASQYRFGDVVGEFVRSHCKQHNRDRHAHETERILRATFASAWADRDLREIAKADVIAILDARVEAGAPSAANHALAAIRKFFAWAAERGLVAENPCQQISRPAPNATRDRVLSAEELAQVWNAAAVIGAPFSQIVQLLVLTAQRRGEVSGMRWDEVDVEARIWTIPAKRTKTNRLQVLPLSGSATDILRNIARTDDVFVFPARGGEGTSASGFSKMKRRLDELSGICDWTLHDLRRSAATHMAGLGVAPHVVERILNHTSGTFGGVAGVYNRFQYIPEMRDALERWAAHIGTLTRTG
jgi:integrase